MTDILNIEKILNTREEVIKDLFKNIDDEKIQAHCEGRLEEIKVLKEMLAEMENKYFENV